MFTIAQIFSAIGGILLLISTFSNSKEKMLKIQIADASANAIADALLGGWAGVCLNAVAIVRNLAIVKNKVTNSVIAILMGVTLFVVVLFDGAGFLPLIASLEYTLIVSKGDLLKSKVALAINLLLWFFYDLTIKSYAVAVADLIILGSTLMQIAKLSNERKSSDRVVSIQFKEKGE